MDVTCLGPATYEVVHDGETYGVDLDSVHCTCPDHEYRDARCKHLVRAALFAAFTDGVRTRFIAAVVRASDDFGCVDGHAGCAGPTGDTLPCQTCIHGTGTGEWTVWAVLVDGRPAREVTPDATVDRGEGVATDGGRELTGDHPLDGRCGECGARYTVDETVTNECPECGYSAFEPVATDGGAPVDDPETCEQCGREGVESYVCGECADAADERREDDVSGSEPADFGGGEGGVDEL
jgi:DNA-directed RNA polymerase subunit RPC12/RpoP